MRLLFHLSKWFGFRKQGDEVRVPWGNIEKIGTDMVIVNVQQLEDINNQSTK